MPSPLDNLCGPGKALQAEAPDANELAGLLRSGNPSMQRDPRAFLWDVREAALAIQFFYPV